jgi:phosphoribosyl-ATP pyrophosphohydrolase/phosphoribosyl-AMP cyclohydrolase/histidinol dehydrogenase
MLKRITPADVRELDRQPFDANTLAEAEAIVNDVRTRGEPALREHAERFGDLAAGEPLLLPRSELEKALALLPADQRALLERVHGRILLFASYQRSTLRDFHVHVPGGSAGHNIFPIDRAGCYAPGGRFPLPSTVLMTVNAARVGGVREVVAASPKPPPVTLAAAALAGADAFLVAGGPHAIAALAYGVGGVPRCDMIVGPGNRWVTAAKFLVSRHVAIDMLAGPSELVILSDESGDAALIAADLLAQAEHDSDALPVLVTTHAPLADAVDRELAAQLADLPTAETARAALANGFTVVAGDLNAAVEIVNRLAPEHLEVQLQDADAVRGRLRTYGAVFIGKAAAEAFGDYGLGPNHVLPTGGTGRFATGLSPLSFLRARTFLRMEAATAEVIADTAALARLERLEAHARSAERRLR